MPDPECPHCGRPMERADDFWFCDNPECPRRTLRYEPPARPPGKADREPEPDES